jgi:hypothetical protein
MPRRRGTGHSRGPSGPGRLLGREGRVDRPWIATDGAAVAPQQRGVARLPEPALEPRHERLADPQRRGDRRLGEPGGDPRRGEPGPRTIPGPGLSGRHDHAPRAGAPGPAGDDPEARPPQPRAEPPVPLGGAPDPDGLAPAGDGDGRDAEVVADRGGALGPYGAGQVPAQHDRPAAPRCSRVGPGDRGVGEAADHNIPAGQVHEPVADPDALGGRVGPGDPRVVGASGDSDTPHATKSPMGGPPMCFGSSASWPHLGHFQMMGSPWAARRRVIR